LIDLVLRRPRGTALVFTALLGLAVVSFFRIPIEGTPDTTLPSLTVSTTWAGADPEAVCEQVSRPIEEAARQLRGVEEVSSTSGLSNSTVTVSFSKGTDMDVVAMELTERISMIRRDLPSTVRPSQVTQSVPREMESEGFLVYSLTGAERPVLKQISEDIVVPALERVDGVSSVIVEGLGSEEILINIDLEALRAYDLTLAHVAYAIRAGVVDRNVGVATDSSGIEAVLRVSSVPGIPGEIEAVPLAYRGGRFVTVGDISHGIGVSYSDQTGAIFRYNGLDQVSLQVDRSPGSNAVATARRVAGAVERIKRSLPQGVMLDLTEDGTEGIVKDLNSLSWRALLSIVLITLVLLALNPSPMTTPLVLSSIVFSAALAVTAVFLAGYTINVLTLSALAIAFGLLVDGAVVVLEGIAYRRRQGMPPMEAAGVGAREVAVPILGGILTTLVALVPLLASEGVLRRLLQALRVHCCCHAHGVFRGVPHIGALHCRSLGEKRLVQGTALGQDPCPLGLAASPQALDRTFINHPPCGRLGLCACGQGRARRDMELRGMAEEQHLCKLQVPARHAAGDRGRCRTSVRGHNGPARWR